MKLFDRLVQVCAAGSLLVIASQSTAVPVVSIFPETSLVAVGDSVKVDVLWDGTDGSYIGDWDIDIGYDGGILSYVSAYDPSGTVIDPVGGVDSFNSVGCAPDGFTCDDLSIPGTVDLFQVSFELDPVSNQDLLGNSFPLATLLFDAIAPGVSPLSFAGTNTFGDVLGIGFDPTLQDGQVCAYLPGSPAECDVAVPAPSTLFSFLLGFTGVLGVTRRRVIA